MKKIGKTFFMFGFVLLAVIQLSPVTALADVNVFAEGAYTATDLVVYIYADTTVGTATELRSAGVKLTYNTSELLICTAEKNEDTWFLGGETYMDPDTTTTAGQVVIILGKLDTDAPTEGVSGDRVLLGKVSFEHLGLTAFTLGLDYGKRGEETPPGSGFYSFKNFVDTETPANALDDTPQVVFSSVMDVHKLGDADKNGTVDAMDMIYLKDSMISVDAYTCYADGDRNDVVDAMDILWIRDHMD